MCIRDRHDIGLRRIVFSAAALHVRDDNRSLHRVAVAEPFLHIVESGAGCGGHRLGTGERGARTGVDGAELILTLHELSAYLRQPFGHHL